jgi:hypothetical protein
MHFGRNLARMKRTGVLNVAQYVLRFPVAHGIWFNDGEGAFHGEILQRYREYFARKMGN